MRVQAHMKSGQFTLIKAVRRIDGDFEVMLDRTYKPRKYEPPKWFTITENEYMNTFFNQKIDGK